MRRLLKNGTVVNVFTDALEEVNVLIEGDRIIGVGDYNDWDADVVEDVTDRYICPGFIDGHIHIESSMLQPSEFARICLPHGTTSLVADPHEIANVAGVSGIHYMLEATEGLPLQVYYMVPSCVPATPFDENGATLTVEDIRAFFAHPRILGLGEMMNYPGVLAEDEEVLAKIRATREAGLLINGHAPLLSGNALDAYISHAVFDDHECSNLQEAMEKLRKGQIIMIRQGTAAKNLRELLPLFDEPFARRCILVTDDKNAADLIDGHIDSIIRKAVAAGKSVISAIRMATLQAAEHFGLSDVGAVAPGYKADLLVLEDLPAVRVRDVYCHGEKVVSSGVLAGFTPPAVQPETWAAVRHSFHMPELTEQDFRIEPKGRYCRVIQVIPGQVITRSQTLPIRFDKDNGIDIDRDILKLAVIERHKNTGHIGLGYICGTGMKRGAIASSVSHDSHNLIVVGTNDADITLAANRTRQLGGGLVVVEGGKVRAELALPIAGLMGIEDAATTARQNEAVHAQAHALGAARNVELFMNMSFVSLSVIPELKMTTIGLVDVDSQQLVSLYAR